MTPLACCFAAIVVAKYRLPKDCLILPVTQAMQSAKSTGRWIKQTLASRLGDILSPFFGNGMLLIAEQSGVFRHPRAKLCVEQVTGRCICAFV